MAATISDRLAYCHQTRQQALDAARYGLTARLESVGFRALGADLLIAGDRAALTLLDRAAVKVLRAIRQVEDPDLLISLGRLLRDARDLRRRIEDAEDNAVLLRALERCETKPHTDSLCSTQGA